MYNEIYEHSVSYYRTIRMNNALLKYRNRLVVEMSEYRNGSSLFKFRSWQRGL